MGRQPYNRQNRVADGRRMGACRWADVTERGEAGLVARGRARGGPLPSTDQRIPGQAEVARHDRSAVLRIGVMVIDLTPVVQFQVRVRGSGLMAQ